jgi:hypothetical protein
VSLDWSNAELAAGLSCYRNGRFFDAHEHWESVWMRLKDPERSFLQGLIQMTVAFHHLNSANSAGARSLLQRALIRFDRCPTCFGGVDVAAIRSEAREWLRAIESEASTWPVSYPKITLIER